MQISVVTSLIITYYVKSVWSVAPLNLSICINYLYPSCDFTGRSHWSQASAHSWPQDRQHRFPQSPGACAWNIHKHSIFEAIWDHLGHVMSCWYSQPNLKWSSWGVSMFGRRKVDMSRWLPDGSVSTRVQPSSLKHWETNHLREYPWEYPESKENCTPEEFTPRRITPTLRWLLPTCIWIIPCGGHVVPRVSDNLWQQSHQAPG